MKPIFYLVLTHFVFLGYSFPVISQAGDGKNARTSAEKKSTFTVNRQWEQRLADLNRSGEDVKVISPKAGLNLQSDDIVFEWSSGTEKNMFLGLLSNENKEVFYKEVNGNRAVIDAKSISLKPGLYYWVLESEDDILALGKFLYKKKP